MDMETALLMAWTVSHPHAFAQKPTRSFRLGFQAAWNILYICPPLDARWCNECGAIHEKGKNTLCNQ